MIENASPEPWTPPRQKSQATLVVVLGILGIWPLFFLGPVAWLLGRSEIAAIDARIRPEARRRRAVIGRRLGIAGTCLWAVLIPAYLIWGDDLPWGRSVSLSGTFDPGETPSFATASDELVELLIEDGQYRIRIHDGGPPQVIRSFNPFTRDSTRFEATVTQVETEDDQAILGIGCFNGSAAYVLAVDPRGEIGLIELRDARSTALRLLSAPQSHSALRPVGEPNRLRIDCYGGGVEPTVITGYANDQPVVAVAVATGIDQFDAFGFWVVANGSFGVTVDEFRWEGESTLPAMSPVTAGTADSVASQCSALVGALGETLQAMMDGMSAWDSFDDLEAASNEELRRVHGDAADEFARRAWRVFVWGCQATAKDALSDTLTASNPVAEEFLSRLFDG